MPWLRVDDRMYCNRKMRPAGNDAISLWVWSADYSADQLTDGILSSDEVEMLAKMRHIADWRKVADELVVLGLFDLNGAYYVVHDYLEYNPSREKVLEDREENRKKQADYQARKKADKPVPEVGANVTGDGVATNPPPNPVSNPVTKPVTNLVPYPSPYPVPGPIPETKIKAADAAAATAAILSETARDFLRLMSRKRFKNDTQKQAFLDLEEEVGRDAIVKAATWAATNGIANFDSFRTRARNIARGISPQPRSPNGYERSRKPIAEGPTYETFDPIKHGNGN